ncbi:hypothetical protein [Trinickia symbiotica]|uniref:hypothetical protein n=1 Tax=Trinickia symbiotica TaxID=863227 RepID=UPI001C633C5A|nr:hypothetical protein [Trinickia symbiotica]
MKNAGGIIGIIAGVFGTGAALVTLLFGGIGAAFNANGAQTVVGLGWGGVFFSFLTIVFGAVVFARPKGAGIALVVTSILGAILGGTLVAIFMGLALIGGVLAIIGSTGARKHDAEAVPAPRGKSAKTFVAWGGAAVVIAVIVAVAVSAGKSAGPSPSTAESDQPQQGTAPSPVASSTPVASNRGTSSERGDADAQEADESGTAIGTVMNADVSPDGSMATPFGKLTVSDDRVLMLDGKPVTPRVEGNNSLSFVAQVALKNRRAVLVRDDGGTACPAAYRWVIVSDGGYTVSRGFGSCSDLAKVSTAAGALVLTMPGFAGPLESAAEQQRAAKKRVKYVYDGKTLMQDGKPVSGQ